MDNEVKGEGNSLNYKYRMHDSRVGRFFAVDPLTKEYPEFTPYQFSSNMPVHAPEFEGLETSVDLNAGAKVSFSLGGGFSATDAFEFFANNSSVEFSHVISDTKSFVSTSHKPSVEYGGPGIVNDLLYKGKNVLEFNHSHPYKRERLMRLLLTEMGVEGVKKFTPGPSGFDPNSKKLGKGDALSAKSVLKASTNTKLHVYDATVQEYIQYNQHGAVHKN